jgi:hypothetical protein
MPDAKHPIWSLIRLTIIMVTMCFVLWMNATKFDETEIRSIVTVFFVAAGVEGIGNYLQRGKKD